MKKIILTTALIFLTSSAFAGMVCTTDYLGRVVCNGTGEDSGYSTRGSTDYLGRETWTDNNGNSQTCTTDYLGRYVCN